MPTQSDEAFRVDDDTSGFAKITMRQQDGLEASLLVEYDRLGFLAARLLGAAHVAFRRSGKTLPNLTETERAHPIIVPTGVALGPSHLPDHQAITLRFGETTLGLSIPKNMLIGLGQAMVALGAEGQAH